MNKSNSFYQNVGNRLKEVRLRKRLTQEDLSELTGLSPKYIGSLERAARGCSAYTLSILCEKLNVSADYVLTGKTMDLNYELLINMLNRFTPDQNVHVEEIITHIFMLLGEGSSENL